MARLVWLKDELLKVANDEIKNAERESWEDAPKLLPSMQVFHYHNDHLGTPNELTNQQGEVVWLADYEAWGNTAKVVWRKEKLEQLQVSADELQPIRFQGQSFDVETGLHYNRFRYYDPDLGMFVSRDPIGLMGGDNLFQYVPSPTRWIDPLGLSASKKDCCNCGEKSRKASLGKDGRKIATNFTRKGQKKAEYLFDNLNDAKNKGSMLLGLSKTRIYDEKGKMTGWQNSKGDKVYWKHNDWGQGVGSSTFPHINYDIQGVTGHFYLRDKMINRGEWCDFAKHYGLN